MKAYDISELIDFQKQPDGSVMPVPKAEPFVLTREMLDRSIERFRNPPPVEPIDMTPCAKCGWEPMFHFQAQPGSELLCPPVRRGGE